MRRDTWSLWCQVECLCRIWTQTVWADTEDLAADVGYQPATPIETGVKNFVDWYLEFYDIKR